MNDASNVRNAAVAIQNLILSGVPADKPVTVAQYNALISRLVSALYEVARAIES